MLVVRGKAEERLRGLCCAAVTDVESHGTRQKFPGASLLADKHPRPVLNNPGTGTPLVPDQCYLIMTTANHYSPGSTAPHTRGIMAKLVYGVHLSLKTIFVGNRTMHNLLPSVQWITFLPTLPLPTLPVLTRMRPRYDCSYRT